MPNDTPVIEPLAVDAAGLGRLLGCISERLVWKLHASGRLPLPIRLGRRTLWVLDGPGGVREWLANGCPPRTNADTTARRKAAKP
jgi:hypothetical protein